MDNEVMSGGSRKKEHSQSFSKEKVFEEQSAEKLGSVLLTWQPFESQPSVNPKSSGKNYLLT